MAPVPGASGRAAASPTPAGGSDVAHASFSPTNVSSQPSRAEPSPSAQRASSAGTLGGSQRRSRRTASRPPRGRSSSKQQPDATVAPLSAHFGSSTHALGGRA